jgi:gas vesicle protein
MTSTDRRHPENAQLREKINHIQDVSEQLQTLVAQVQVQTVAWAREGKVVDLPSADLASHLSHAFEQQRAELAQLQEDIKGTATRVAAPALITDEELAALMK